MRRRRAEVVYHPDYALGFAADPSGRRGFDVARCRKVAAALVANRWMRWRDFLKPRPASEHDLERVHDRAYLERLREDPRYLAELLQVELEPPWEGELWAKLKLIVGGTILTGAVAWRTRRPVFNLAGGFHHAFPDRGEGFCAVNDVAVAIRWLQRRHQNLRILVIDLDAHPGNGTAAIFAADPEVHTYSLHGTAWQPCDDCRANTELVVEPSDGRRYLELLAETLPPLLDRFAPHFVWYLAGADVWRGDRLGGMHLTLAEVQERDRFVQRELARRCLPVGVLPAGGYSHEAWRIYYAQIRAVLAGEVGW